MWVSEEGSLRLVGGQGAGGPSGSHGARGRAGGGPFLGSNRLSQALKAGVRVCGCASVYLWPPAPELLEQKPYGKAVDVWALGVISYIL